MYAFLHIPKTAGLALGAAFRKVFGDEKVSSPVGPEWSPIPVAQYALVLGHISYTDRIEHFPDRSLLTVLRDPVDRCVSSYWYLRTRIEQENSAEEILAREHSIESLFRLDDVDLARSHSNRMTRQLGAHVLDYETSLDTALDNAKRTLENAVWIGQYETLTKDLEDLQAIPAFAGLPRLDPINVTPHKEKTPQAVRDLIAERNRYDIELYEWASRLRK